MNLFVTFRADNTLLAILTQLLDIGQQILTKENQIMTTLQEDVDKIALLTTRIGGLSAVIQSLIDRIITTVPGLTPEQQAMIDAIGVSVDQNIASFDAAVALNTPPAQPPTEVPPVV